MEAIAGYEHELVEYAMERLEEIPGVNVIGPPADKRGGVMAFTLDGVHPHDISQILDLDGVAIRAGHHCAMPLHTKLNLPASARASFYLYNTLEEIDRLVVAIYKVKKLFS
jgi:cysteine desulfurase/selenocysteine lyase